jgi:hypothetical protein
MRNHHFLFIVLFSKLAGLTMRPLMALGESFKSGNDAIADAVISVVDCNYENNPGLIVDDFTEKDLEARNCILGLHITGESRRTGGIHLVQAKPDVMISGYITSCKEDTGVPVTRVVIVPGTTEGEAPPMEMLANAVNTEMLMQALQEEAEAEIEAEFDLQEEANADSTEGTKTKKKK